jgi:Ca-activated chloride channel family protein
MGHTRTVRAGVLAGATILALTAGCTASPSSGGPDRRPPDRASGDEGFQPEIDTRDEPDSTFAIDVDTASYTYARRQILDGAWVDPDTVRPEEFINAFDQDYPEPRGNGFSVTVDGARIPPAHGDGYHLMRVGLRTRSVDPQERSDVALTFVVDVSGSMAEPGRLDLVRDALHTLVDQLRSTDYVAIVAYDDEAWVLCELTPARNRDVLHEAIDELEPGGSTNLEAGLVTGYQVARDGFVEGASNRVILLSDGLANTGNTEAEPILAQIREEARKQIALLGVGVGSEYGDALMERLADEGDGFVTYVSERAQARELFVERLPATLVVRAMDAKVQVSFDPASVTSYRLVGYDNRVLDTDDFRDDRVDGGEVGPGHSVTALYLVRLRRGAEGHLADARIRWLDPQDRRPSENVASVTVHDLDIPFASASPRLRVDYAAGFFAEVLRDSPYGRDVRLEDLADIVESAARQTEDGQVGELGELIALTIDSHR